MPAYNFIYSTLRAHSMIESQPEIVHMLPIGTFVDFDFVVYVHVLMFIEGVSLSGMFLKTGHGISRDVFERSDLISPDTLHHWPITTILLKNVWLHSCDWLMTSSKLSFSLAALLLDFPT